MCPLPLEPPSYLLPPIPSPLGYYRALVWVPGVTQQSPAGCLFTCGSVCFHASLSIRLTPSSSPPPLSKSILYVCGSLTHVSYICCIGRQALYHQHHWENLRDNKTMTFSFSVFPHLHTPPRVWENTSFSLFVPPLYKSFCLYFLSSSLAC